MSSTKAKTEEAKKGAAPEAKAAPADVAKAAGEEIMAKATAKLKSAAGEQPGVEVFTEVSAPEGAILVAEDDQLGRSPDNDTTKKPHVQRDTLPGTMRPDMTDLPEFAYDQDEDRDRRVSVPSEYAYCWVADALVQRYRTLGYKFCLYNGGSSSGLADRGLRGTGLFESTLSKHVRNGDCVLMWAPMRLRDHLDEMDRKQVSNWNRAAQGDLHNLGYQKGIRTFEENDGKIREYN